MEFAVRKSAGTGKYVEKVEELLKAAKENVRSRTKRGLAGGVTGKRTACIRDGSRDKQGGEIGEIPAGGRKGDETEVPSAKRPRIEEREASGEGDEEQAVSDDEDVVIVGVTRGKKKSRWNAVSGQHTLFHCTDLFIACKISAFVCASVLIMCIAIQTIITMEASGVYRPITAVLSRQ